MEQFIAIALWIPFLLIAVIIGIKFALTGYRSGLWRSLASLGATVLAALLSTVLAVAVARPLAAAIIEPVSDQGIDSATAVLLPFLAAILQSILALFVFSLILFVLVLVLKPLADRLVQRFVNCDGAFLPWAGLAVRVLDVLLYASLILLPLYGTISTYLAPVNSVIAIAPQDEETRKASQILDSVVSHPVTRFCSRGPAYLVCQGLTSVSMDNGTLNITAASDSLCTTLDMAHGLVMDAQNSRLTGKKVSEFTDYLQSEVLEQEWCYTAYQELTCAVSSYLSTSSHPALRDFGELMDVDRKGFVQNADAVLDFTGFLLQEDVLNRLTREGDSLTARDLEEIGLPQQIGQLINASPQAVACRHMLVFSLLDNDRYPSQEIRDRIIDAWCVEASADPDVQLRQGRAFVALMNASNGLSRMCANIDLSPQLREDIRDYVFTAPLVELLPDILEDSYRCYFPSDGESVSDTVGLDHLTAYLGGQQQFRQFIWDQMEACSRDAYSWDIGYRLEMSIHLSNLGSSWTPVIGWTASKSIDPALDLLGSDYFSWLESSGRVRTAWCLPELTEKTVALVDEDTPWAEWHLDGLWPLARAIELSATGADPQQLGNLLARDDAIQLARELVQAYGPDPLHISQQMDPLQQDNFRISLSGVFWDDWSDMTIQQRDEIMLAFFSME